MARKHDPSKQHRCSRCKVWRPIEEFPFLRAGVRTKQCARCVGAKASESLFRKPPYITTETVALLNHFWISKEPRMAYAQAMEIRAKGLREFRA